MPRLATFALGHVLVAAALLLGTTLASGDSAVVRQALLWVPSGVAVASVWLLGAKSAWVIAAVVWAHRAWSGYGPVQCGAAAIGSVGEALLAVWLLRRLGLRADFARLRDVLILMAAAFVAPWASILGTWGTRVVLDLAGLPGHGGWLGWWRMNALGILVVVPLALVWLASTPGAERTRKLPPNVLVAFVTLLLVGAVMMLVEPGTPSVLLTTVLMVALGSAMLLGPTGAVTTAATAALVIAALSARGIGAFQAWPYEARHVAVQVFLFALVLVPLVFGALIAERAATARQWRESEGIRSALLTALPDTTYTIRPDGTFLDAVLSTQDDMVTRAQVVGRRLQDLVAPDMAARHLEAIHRAHRGENTVPIEYQIDTKTGRRDREVRYVRLPSGNVLALVRDITARKRAERELAWQARVLEMVASRRSQREVFVVLVDDLEKLLPAAMAAIMLRRGNRLWVGHAPSVPDAVARLGDGIEIGPGRGTCGTAAHENRTVVSSDLGLDPAWATVRDLVRAHGVHAAWAVPVRGADGATLGTVAIYHRAPHTPSADEIVLVEHAAMLAGLAIDRDAREDLLASIQRNISEGLFRSLPNAGLAHANDAFARMFGYSSPEAMLQQLAADDPGPAAHRQSLERLTAAQPLQQVEMELFRRDGSQFCGLVSTTIVHDATGARAACDGTVADITAKKQLEDHLRQAQKMEAVGQLAGGVAHDFNNLLTAIGGFAESVHEGLPGGSPLRKDVREITHAADRAASLTRQLLAFGRRQVMSPRVVDLVDVVDGTSVMLRRLIGEHIALQLVHALPRVSARVDRGQMEQVLLNLVLNARDALPNGGTITVGTDAVEAGALAAAGNGDLPPGPHALLWVSDDGVGMTPEVRSRAFDPFFTTKELGKGSGLGLSMVYGIVRQSGGAVRIDSVPDRGTTVLIWLPRVDDAPDEEPVVTIPRPLTTRVDAGTVLVAEDEELVRSLAQRALTRAGYTVLAAADGQEALEIVASRGGALDAIVSDVVMPRMSGRELAARLRQNWPHIPVLLMTGYANDGNDPLLGDDYLPKPFTAAGLAAATARAIERGKSRLERRDGATPSGNPVPS